MRHPAVLVGALCFITAACSHAPAAGSADAQSVRDGEVVLDSASPKLAAIGVDTVRTTRERAVATLPAQLVLDENHTVRVFSPVTGRVHLLYGEPGSLVALGAPLARITSSDMAQASSDQAKADAALAQTAAALTRAESLYAHEVIAARDLEQARSDAAQARAEAERARQRTAQLGGSDGIAGDFVLRSPVAGTVIDRATNTGAEVRPDAASPLFTVSSLDTLWLVASAPQRDLQKLRPGARLVFRSDAAPGHSFDARVTYVSDQLDPVTRTASVRASVDNRDHGLRAMLIGVARLMVADGIAHVIVPTTALVTRGSEAVVFVQTSRGHFSRREVSVDDDDGTTASIREGLKPGELVVTRGSVLLAAEAERLP